MLALRRYFRGKTHILWDWNGTLLNDADLCVSTIGSLLREHGLPEISVEEYRQKFCFPVIEYYKSLGFDFEKLSFEEVGTQFIERYRKGSRTCKLFSGAADLVKILHREGIKQSILSAAEQQHLREITAWNGIDQYFEHICGLSDHYATSKVERGRQLIQDSGIDRASTLLVGDTDHDVEVGRELGIDVLILADGHQTFDRLTAIHHNVLPSRYPSATINS